MVDEKSRWYFQRAMWHLNQYRVCLNYAYWIWINSKFSDSKQLSFADVVQDERFPENIHSFSDTYDNFQYGHNLYSSNPPWSGNKFYNTSYNQCYEGSKEDPNISVNDGSSHVSYVSDTVNFKDHDINVSPHKGKHWRGKKRRKTKKNANKNNAELETNKILESDVSVELDENFRKFLEISEKHRAERAKSKEGRNKTENNLLVTEEDIEIEYIDAGSKTIIGSTKVPSLRNKQSDYIERYGDEGQVILGLETALQLDFDKYLDKKQPVFWPYIPIRL